MKIALLTIAAVCLAIGLFFLHRLLPYIVVGGFIVALLYWKLKPRKKERR